MEFFTSNSQSQPNNNPFVYSSPPNYSFMEENMKARDNLDPRMYEDVMETQRALIEQKKKVEEEKKLRYPVLSFPNFFNESNPQTNEPNSPPTNNFYDDNANNNANYNNSNNINNNVHTNNNANNGNYNTNDIINNVHREENHESDPKFINQRLLSFISNVERRLESMEKNLQNLMNDFYSSNNNQSKFNEEFLKAISSLSNDISTAKSAFSGSPSASISPVLSVSPALPLPVVNAPQNNNIIGSSQSFPFPPLSEFAKKNQEETDQEIAKRLQEEFDKQQRQQPPQPQQYSAVPTPVVQPVEPKEDCPVCGVSFPVKSLPVHVETHFQQGSNPSLNPVIPNAIPPSNQPNSPTNQGGFFSKIFGATKKKDDLPTGPQSPPQYQPIQGQPIQVQQPMQIQPIQGQPIQGAPVYYNPGSYPVARPPTQVYRLPPGQVPPQGSIVYRPPPNGFPQNPPQYMNPDGSIVYAVPQPPK